MKIGCFLLAASLFLSPALGWASDHLKHGALALLSLRQLSDRSGDQLPQDILYVLGKTLTGLDRRGIWSHEGAGKRWVPFTKAVEAMKAFRDGESSKAEIMAVLESKQQIKKSLLVVLSAQWDEDLEGLMNEHRPVKDQWNRGKAYGAAFLAYYMIEVSAAYSAAMYVAFNAAKDAAWAVAWDAARKAASNAAWVAARDAARNAAWVAARNAAWASVHHSVSEKWLVLGSQSAHPKGMISYDLAELFSLLWLTEYGHGYMKMTFEAAYKKLPDDLTIEGAKAIIDAAIVEQERLGIPHLVALRRDLESLEIFLKGVPLQ